MALHLTLCKVSLPKPWGRFPVTLKPHGEEESGPLAILADWLDSGSGPGGHWQRDGLDSRGSRGSHSLESLSRKPMTRGGAVEMAGCVDSGPRRERLWRSVHGGRRLSPPTWAGRAGRGQSQDTPRQHF